MNGLIEPARTSVSKIVSIWHLTEGSGMFQKVVVRSVNIGYFHGVLWISLADSDPRLQLLTVVVERVTKNWRPNLQWVLQ